MCGIIGKYSRNGINRDLLVKQSNSMRHRGPDNQGVWFSKDGCVGLANNRLSIIDLSLAGNQPMLDEGRGIAITFNGEIYNYKDIRAHLQKCNYIFKSNSDTEVILAAYKEWGIECLDHLHGMFAFGLYDLNYKTLFLGRDRAGEKPLYYSSNGSEFVFASELKALMADPAFSRSVNSTSLECYLSFGYAPGELCILNNVKKLPAGHALTFKTETNELKSWKYWDLPEYNEKNVINDEQRLIEEFETIFSKSISQQLKSDVPIGILLSGGIDSSLITAFASKIRPDIKTFTIRFPGYGQYDETEHARLIASAFNTTHIELVAEETTVDLLPILARQFDEPIVDSSIIPTYLVSKLAREHCTVVLGGDGGDELFGGYSHYSRLLKFEKYAKPIPAVFRNLLGSLAILLPVGFKGRNLLSSLDFNIYTGLPLNAPYFSRADRANLISSTYSFLNKGIAEQVRKNTIPESNNIIDRACRIDFKNYLAEDILVKIDRTGMLNSLENRAPFLDTRLIEFAFSKVPLRYKVSISERKILLKKMAQKWLPSSFDVDRKQGFSIPLASWLKTNAWKECFSSVLIGSPLFDSKYINKLMKNQDHGYCNSERLFSLVLFQLWCNEYKVSI
jgi:asparagine synthase (glutamine-hydrolysing)